MTISSVEAHQDSLILHKTGELKKREKKSGINKLTKSKIHNNTVQEE